MTVVFATPENQVENRSVHRFRAVLASAVASLCLLTAHAQKPATGQRPALKAPVDINHAPLEELLRVPGMTSTWAARIVRFRPYRAKSDLVDRGVVSIEVYSRIRNSIIAHRGKQ